MLLLNKSTLGGTVQALCVLKLLVCSFSDISSDDEGVLLRPAFQISVNTSAKSPNMQVITSICNTFFISYRVIW